MMNFSNSKKRGDKMGRKKWFRILLCCECFLFFMLEISGCSGQASYKQPSSSIVSEPETAEFYQDEQLNFTFRIPPCWISENPLYTQETIFDESSKNGYTSFYYAHDPSVPLLRIFLESQKYSNDKFSVQFSSLCKDQNVFFLGENKNGYYYAVLPESCSLPIGKEADLYNSMALSENDVKRRFSIES